ncbi:MAG: hypothetical protein IPM55_17840 [Acidobacteria bacterium]|nr:hypothetical protein [Acidobacteriota bacterium]
MAKHPARAPRIIARRRRSTVWAAGEAANNKIKRNIKGRDASDDSGIGDDLQVIAAYFRATRCAPELGTPGKR